MKQIQLNKNAPCFCNSNKEFKKCCGFGITQEVENTFKIYYMLRGIYGKIVANLSNEYDIKKFVEDFKIYNNIPEDIQENLEVSFKFIDFLIFKGEDRESKKSILEIILEKNFLNPGEKEFLKQLSQSSKFSIFKILNYNEKTHFLKLENIFTGKIIEFYNKSLKNLETNGLIYGRDYEIFNTKGILPTFNFKKAEEIKDEHIKKSKEGFKQRYEKEESKLSFEEFINSIEHEIYGGDNPYEKFEYDEKFEEFKKNNPGKDFDDFLDEIEDEILEL